MMSTKPSETVHDHRVSSPDQYDDSDSIFQVCSEARNVKDALLRTGSWGCGACLQKLGSKDTMVRKEARSQKLGQNSQALAKDESRCQAVLARPKGSAPQSRVGKEPHTKRMFWSLWPHLQQH